MKLPIVAVVGRPNVGKSTFFNRIAGKRISIIEDKPGVTRDRLYADCEWCGYNFTLIDTGGLEVRSDDVMWSHIREQAEVAVELADVILFMTDGKDGLLPGDWDIAEFLRKHKKPTVLAVNKLDNNETDRLYEFYELGMGEPTGFSAEQAKGLGDVLDEVVSNFERIDTEQLEKRINIAVVGKPNAGKSSIVNKLLGYDRVIVSDIAGTTRDAVDTPFTWNGQNFNLIDTAGIRRKRSIDENVESYSVMRALTAIRRADVVLIVCDASDGLNEQFVRICGYADREGKPSVIVMNKWDLVEKDTHTINGFNKVLEENLKFMDYFVPLYISAKTGQRVDKIMEKATEVYETASGRVQTSILNEIIRDAISVNQPPAKNGKRFKAYYVTQSGTNPPTFVFSVNDKKCLHFAYERYLENTVRKTFGFKGTPIRFIYKDKSDSEYEF